MKVCVQLRVNPELKIQAAAAAAINRMNMSELITKAVEPYLSGRKTLPQIPKNASATTSYSIEHDTYMRFKEIAENTGLSVNQAVLWAMQELIKDEVRAE